MGDGDGGDVGGRTFPILYITTPDQPPHGGVTGNSKVLLMVVKEVNKFAEPTAQRRVGSRANLSFCKIFNLA